MGDKYVTVASLWRHVSTFPEFDGKNRSVLLADLSHSYSGNNTTNAMGDARYCHLSVRSPHEGKNNAANE